MQDLIIKKLGKGDIKQVQMLIKQLDAIYQAGHDISLNTIRKTLSQMQKKSHIYRNFVTKLHNEVIGFISAVFLKPFFMPVALL